MTRHACYRTIGLIIAATWLTSCSTMANRPTTELMDRWFGKPKYIATFDSALSPTQLRQLAQDSPCQGGTINSTESAPVGPSTYSAVTVSVQRTAQYGDIAGRITWAALRFDSFGSHSVVMAFKAFPTADGSRVEVAPVKQGMAEEIKAHVERGHLFCNWLLFSDPWRY
jgi:hypothetical protein